MKEAKKNKVKFPSIIIVDGHDGSGKSFFIKNLISIMQDSEFTYHIHSTNSSRELKSYEIISSVILKHSHFDFIILDRWILSSWVYDTIDNKEAIDPYDLNTLLSNYNVYLFFCKGRRVNRNKHNQNLQHFKSYDSLFQLAYDMYPYPKLSRSLSGKKQTIIKQYAYQVLLNCLKNK